MGLALRAARTPPALGSVWLPAFLLLPGSAAFQEYTVALEFLPHRVAQAVEGDRHDGVAEALAVLAQGPHHTVGRLAVGAAQQCCRRWHDRPRPGTPAAHLRRHVVG